MREYLDIVKDRLYVEKAGGHARRSAQTACYYTLDTLTRLIAPILSFTAERISDQYQKNKSKSIHLLPFASLQPLFDWIANKKASWQYDAGEGREPAGFRGSEKGRSFGGLIGCSAATHVLGSQHQPQEFT